MSNWTEHVFSMGDRVLDADAQEEEEEENHTTELNFSDYFMATS